MVFAARLAFNLALPTEAPGAGVPFLPARDTHWIRNLYEKAVAGFYEVVLSGKGWRVRPGETPPLADGEGNPRNPTDSFPP